MTVYEYRKKHPKCEYCHHRIPGCTFCTATYKSMKKRTAKKCPCYVPESYGPEKCRYDERSDTE